ncbi:hypothetical protein MTR_7g105270 [Medicago truncatula]|uniref:CCHC-type domain-containing protein n=1 Tax=Medicago truncatula TaxID=3880 RepID=A0A072U4T4_MEDTR|nr:hypothetical protein MTR_7g105270 [Medicago truncatula]
MRRQIQQLQEIVNAQQALLEAQQKRFKDHVSGSDSSSSRSSRSQRRELHMNDIKVDIPDFEGNLQPDDFLDWLQIVERLFKYKEVPEEQKVKIVAAKLKKLASIWWENLKRKRKREGKSKIKTWEKMRQKLIRKYLPPHYYQYNFTQPQLSKKSSYRHFSPTKNQIDSHKPIFTFKPRHKTITEINTNIPKCFMCQGYGHIAIDCVNYKAVTIVNREINNIFGEEKEDIPELFEDETMGEPIYDEGYVGSDICEVFEEEGKGDPIYDEYGPDDIHEALEKEEHDEPIYDEEYVLAEYGEYLEIEKSFQTSINKDMVFNVIIDNKSGENVASNYIEEELKFRMINHQDPYKLQWLNKDYEVKVSQHSIISFSIDKNYKENVRCDVIPMDTCHTHLGRPWQYDHRALYDGYTNINTFVKYVTKEPLKDTTKLYMFRPIPKPPWEVVSMDFSLDYYGVSATFNVADLSPYFGDEEDFRLEDESSPTRGE